MVLRNDSVTVVVQVIKACGVDTLYTIVQMPVKEVQWNLSVRITGCMQTADTSLKQPASLVSNITKPLQPMYLCEVAKSLKSQI